MVLNVEINRCITLGLGIVFTTLNKEELHEEIHGNLEGLQILPGL